MSFYFEKTVESEPVKIAKQKPIKYITVPDPVRRSKDGGCQNWVACIALRGKFFFWAVNTN